MDESKHELKSGVEALMGGSGEDEEGQAPLASHCIKIKIPQNRDRKLEMPALNGHKQLLCLRNYCTF